MDPVTIAAGVGALLAPYFKKGVESFAGEAGKYVFGKAKEVWEKLRAKLAGDAQAEATLDRFEHDPDGARKDLEAQVEKHAKADASLGDELAQVLAEIKRQAPHVKVVQDVQEAENLIGIEAGRVSRGTVEVDQKVGKATGTVTGGKFGDIG